MAEDPNSVNPYSSVDARNANEMAQAARSLTEELKDQLGVRSRLNETQRETLNLARQLQRSAQENTVEIGNSGNIQRQLNKDTKLLLGIKREIEDLTDLASNKAEVKSAEKIVDLTEQIKKKSEELANATGKRAEKLADEIAIAEDILKYALEDNKETTKRLALAISLERTAAALIKNREEEANIQRRISDQMGVTGALVKGTGALMQRLGMRSGIFQQAMQDSEKAMRKMAEEAVRSEKAVSKTSIMLKGFSVLAKGFGKALFDPFTLSTKLLLNVLAINKAAVEFRRSSAASTKEYTFLATRAATVADLLQTVVSLNKQLGLDTSVIFNKEQLGQISDAKLLLGLSEQETAGLAVMMKMTAQSADDIGNAIYDSVDAGVNKKQVMSDVLSASKDIVAATGSNTRELSRSASAARALGLNLSEVDAIASKLLDFESSIGAELEAQIMTGRQINLGKARQLALDNDLEGVAKELSKNGASAAEFAKMGRLEQESLAKALGMSRTQLANMVLTEEARSKMTDKEIAKARGMSLEQSKQLDIQQQLQKTLFKLGEPLAVLLESLLPIFNTIAKLLENQFIKGLVQFGVAGIVAVKTFSTVGKLLGGVNLSMGGFVKNILKAVKGFDLLNIKQKLFGKMYKGGQFLPGGGQAKAGGQRAGGLFGKATPKTPPIDPKASKGTTSFLDSFSKIPMKKVLQGAGAILILSGAMFIAAKALKEFEGVEFEQVMFGIGTIAALSVVARALGNVGPAILEGALAIAVLSASLIPLGFALNLAAPGIEAFGKVITSTFKGLSTLVTAVAIGFERILGAVTMDNIMPMLLLGPALMGIAAGLGAVSVAGLAALPTLTALTGLGMVATPLAKIMGGSSKESSSEESTLKTISGKLDRIASALEKGADINLDSEKIGTMQYQNATAQGS